MQTVKSWGGISAEPHRIVQLNPADQPVYQSEPATAPVIAHGAGLSYGDCSLNPQGTLLLTKFLDQLFAFDENTGELICGAGLTLESIQDIFMPRGWSLPVTPGTLKITLGGAIANDIHGKNHHVRGSFGHHLTSLELQRSDGSVLHCNAQQHPEYLAATIGGLGLTGIIVKAGIRLIKSPGPWLQAEKQTFDSIADYIGKASAADQKCEHSVGWLDAYSEQRGRGILLTASPGDSTAAPPTRWLPTLGIPFTPPLSLINQWTTRLHNDYYYRAQTRQLSSKREYYKDWLYPLDGISHWNRIYGSRGFFQYQCHLPHGDAEAAINEMLQVIKSRNTYSFLAVIKRFGQQEPLGMLSFARPGITLAMDFANQGKSTEDMFKDFDSIVFEAGGSLYLAKDARMPRTLFEASYPGIEEFLNYRDPGLSSGMSRRLFGS